MKTTLPISIRQFLNVTVDFNVKTMKSLFQTILILTTSALFMTLRAQRVTGTVFERNGAEKKSPLVGVNIFWAELPIHWANLT
jgi:hypothetical protein